MAIHRYNWYLSSFGCASGITDHILMYSRFILLDRVPVVTGVAAYSRQTFRERSVGRCVGLSSALQKNGGSDPEAVWHHSSDGSRNEAGSGVCGSVHGKEYFWGRI